MTATPTSSRSPDLRPPFSLQNPPHSQAAEFTLSPSVFLLTQLDLAQILEMIHIASILDHDVTQRPLLSCTYHTTIRQTFHPRWTSLPVHPLPFPASATAASSNSYQVSLPTSRKRRRGTTPNRGRVYVRPKFRARLPGVRTAEMSGSPSSS